MDSRSSTVMTKLCHGPAMKTTSQERLPGPLCWRRRHVTLIGLTCRLWSGCGRRLLTCLWGLNTGDRWCNPTRPGRCKTVTATMVGGCEVRLTARPPPRFVHQALVLLPFWNVPYGFCICIYYTGRDVYLCMEWWLILFHLNTWKHVWRLSL